MSDILSDEESDEVDDFPPLPPPPPVGTRQQRTSISAEAYGVWNRRQSYAPPEYWKTPEQTEELTEVLNRSFLFNTLETKDLQVVVLAMKGPLVLEPGYRLITEGDSGDALYVVLAGILDCDRPVDGVSTVVKSCVRGDLFGELALLYNCPRNANVVSREASEVWELDRMTFSNIVMEAVKRKRTQCAEVLRNVPLFAGLKEGEIENIIDALKLVKFPGGTTIIQQGDEGNDFFIIYDGEVIGTRYAEGEEPLSYVHQAGDYFGEVSLLKNVPRTASVVAATEEVQVLSMDRETFKRLMGPVEAFLEEGVGRYG